MRKVCLKMIALLLPLLVFIVWSGQDAEAAGRGKIVLDNQELALPKGIVLENVNGSVMIPIRVVTENLGYEVLWDQTTRKVTIRQDFKAIELFVGSKKADADGVPLSLNAAPKQTGGTVLVPIRFVGEQFGLGVGWDNKEKIVYLSGNSSDSSPAAPETWPASTPSPSASPVVSSPAPTPAPSQTTGTVAGAASSPPQSAEIPAGTAAGASVQVKGADFVANQLIIAVTGTVKPNISTLDNPSRIVVELPGTSLAADFAGGGTVSGTTTAQGTLDVSEYPLIAGLRYSLSGTTPSAVRFEIQTTETLAYRLSVDDSTGLITVDLNASDTGGTTSAGGGKPVIVLDAGHGGSQPGAISAAGRQEKDFNLAVIQKAGVLLQSDGRVTVVFTRMEDITLGLQDRVHIAEEAGANLFVSLHANAMPTTASNWNKVNGSETYYSRNDSLPLARVMHTHLVKGTGFKDNGVRAKSLHVTRETSMPAVLLEAGYLTNTSEESMLFSNDLQDSLAREIAAGIIEYLGI
ncbi:N-acetylmuramoyl-L-alanine amidase [Paenibacillus sophorae]|uniref:N-acetylmuramoyl-L-alanine amidase n=1 Tax=Paenibacillus sophorae TaxID=1333845 RepID=A0A1H8NJK0_9BACL|nr:N-acetylmuramoyl-L-alanine amidase [Paenibacillus sophorae]QWU14582.1 N-acetylmuramoyl-L-alanine amidase family protein [Paenibacillus sophorae]SEO29911.1 N-acetylmuramoyl-L-alanine amidase [Paenibacillus sophorae]